MTVLQREAGQTPDGFSDPRDSQWQQTSTSNSKWNEQKSGSDPEVLALESQSSRFRNTIRITFSARETAILVSR